MVMKPNLKGLAQSPLGLEPEGAGSEVLLVRWVERLGVLYRGISSMSLLIVIFSLSFVYWFNYECKGVHTFRFAPFLLYILAHSFLGWELVKL